MNNDFEEIGKYKGYMLTKITTGGVVWSCNDMWLGCVFDTVNTAKYFIDVQKQLTDNFFNVIAACQKKSIEINDGFVSRIIVDEFVS